MKAILALTLLLAAHGRQLCAADPVADESKLLNGQWTPIAAILGGRTIPSEELKKITLTLSDGSYETTVAGEAHSDKGTTTRDTSTTPRRLTIKSLEGPNKGKTFLAIYEFKKVNGVDAYRVCYDLSGTAFPTEFKSAKDTHLFLVGYRRKKEPGHGTTTKPTGMRRYARTCSPCMCLKPVSASDAPPPAFYTTPRGGVNDQHRHQP